MKSLEERVFMPNQNGMTSDGYALPSSVVEFVLPHQMASLIRGGANAGPWRKEELCPKGTPRRDADAATPPKARRSSPCCKDKLKLGEDAVDATIWEI